MVTRTFNGLGICSGLGALELALRLTYGDRYQCVGHVEWETYAAAVLVARMEEETLDRAPIWDDIKTFPSEQYRGKVDIVAAGFPCQPFSTAGSGAGKDDDRWLWPVIAEHIAVIGPRIVFMENVPGLRRQGLPDILQDLAALGFDAEWTHCRASDLGAPHKRERFFLLAHSNSEGPEGFGFQEGGWAESPPEGDRLDFPPGPDGRWDDYGGPQPSVLRSPHGSPSSLERSDRLRTCGNSVVPVVAAYAYITLAERFATNEPLTLLG